MIEQGLATMIKINDNDGDIDDHCVNEDDVHYDGFGDVNDDVYDDDDDE